MSETISVHIISIQGIHNADPTQDDVLVAITDGDQEIRIPWDEFFDIIDRTMQLGASAMEEEEVVVESELLNESSKPTKRMVVQRSKADLDV